jgi:hypothetical protein
MFWFKFKLDNSHIKVRRISTLAKVLSYDMLKLQFSRYK